MQNVGLEKIVGLFELLKFDEAEESCLALLEQSNVEKESLYIILLEISKRRKDDALTFRYLEILIELNNKKTCFYYEKAELCYKRGMIKEGISCYEKLIARRPDYANARYNFAIYLKRCGEPNRALESYRVALSLNIDNPSEVYLNMGVIYAGINDADNAIEHYFKALKANKSYLPAMYNLGGIYEELGEKNQAAEQYLKICSLEPDNIKALTRLLYLKGDQALGSEELQRLESVLRRSSTNISNIELEASYFALGHSHDVGRDYPKAFYYFTLANDLGSRRVDKYLPIRTENETIKILSHFTELWREKNQLDNDFAPIFVCGMFRSGSTLIESLLSEHPHVVPGGELNFLHQSIRNLEADITNLGKPELKIISENYRNLVSKANIQNGLVVDKRPDNFKYIGLIKAIFPNAKIICTDRNTIDTCLSVYFQQLDSSLGYAVKLEYIAHYYQEYKKLLRHWQNLFPNDIYVADYERLVDFPMEVCNEVFEHCNLVWDDDYLDFYNSNRLVKTASIWQVRKPLKRGVSRSQNYKSEIHHIKAFEGFNSTGQ
ncbi:Tetratricopeptide TPR_2 [Paraglaciecola sp. T6c]|uniref:tetratricopeptide repeat-containing sulfotransferase family protein n=1 Tax=Pseudoalteromonas atlantica (strain T6c / ATCC BAA-1087) TaxID=3042615 RepID=UPI00005C68F9|nr:sulfotransferase [Paraglaciecola sp. T6c]ABG41500.1 Tetratricopeptide TPR_2 [Paraglaciecola sp. T6c]